MDKKIIKVETVTQKRVDKYLAEVVKEYSREFFKVLCKNKYVKVNNRYVDPDDKVSDGDVIEITIPEREEYIIGKLKDVEIIYEDESLIVFNKPAFLKVHPARKFDSEPTLMDLLLQKIPDSAKDTWPLSRPFLVHRLDKETSGVLIVAKLPEVQFELAKQFQERLVKKVYRAIVSGIMEEETGEIFAPVKKYKNISLISDAGREAKTLFKVLSTNKEYNVSYLELYPITGRTHQIRTHLSFIGHPVIGDVYYNGTKYIAGKMILRTMLHAYKIKFYHPRRKKWVEYTAELPEDFTCLLSELSL